MENLTMKPDHQLIPMNDVLEVSWVKPLEAGFPATAQPVPVVGEGDDDEGIFTDKPLYNLVKSMTANGTINEKVSAIKVVRQNYTVGLATARDYVESIINDGSFPVKLEVERLRAANERLSAQLAALTRQQKAATGLVEACKAVDDLRPIYLMALRYKFSPSNPDYAKSSKALMQLKAAYEASAGDSEVGK